MPRAKIRLIVIVIFSITILCVVASIWIYRDMEAWANFDAKEEALENTEKLLIGVQTSQENYYLKNHQTGCLFFLQEALRENVDKYDLEVIYYNWDNPEQVFRDVDEVTTKITFPDGRWAEAYWYEGGFRGCTGHQEYLTVDDIDARLMEIANIKLPKSVKNVWGTEIFVYGTSLYIRFSTTKAELETFWEEFPNLSHQLESELDFDYIIYPFHFDNDLWVPENLEEVEGTAFEWSMNESSFRSIMMFGSNEGNNLQKVYWYISLPNEMNGS
jgi:hypothetical protein